jgi:hypothetical protein
MGIWSMQCIGIPAYSLPVTIFYHWPTILLPLLAAIHASAVALIVASRNEMGPLRIGVGGLLMGDRYRNHARFCRKPTVPELFRLLREYAWRSRPPLFSSRPFQFATGLL